MSFTRRRFLAISAAALAAPGAAGARPSVWRGRALGAAAEIRLAGPMAGEALAAVRDLLARIESAFSLFDPGSEISRLNRGEAVAPSPDFQRLWDDVQALHEVTGGLFDPGVQPRWRALAEGRHLPASPAGLAALVRARGRMRLAEGAGLTFNGIAQGYATDRVFELLRALGFSEAVVNMGEFRAGVAGARLAVAGPDRQIARVTLRDGALATSSPWALRVGGAPHILHPRDPGFSPTWRTVAVEARTAAWADALSTALCLTSDLALAERLKAGGVLRGAWFEAPGGRVHRV